MSKSKNELTREEEQVLDTADLAGAEPGDEAFVVSVAELEKEQLEEEPAMTDRGWHDWVMWQFGDDELDPNGKPLVHGLRRVAQLLLGPILDSQAEVVQAPAFIPGSERLGLLQPAVVRYTVRLLMCRLEQGLSEAYPVTYSDVADVYYGNTDPEFVRYATATAATRAEARCLRKLLRLRSCASEELTAVPVEDASVDGYITPTQISFLNVLCRRNNINLMRFVNSGKQRYERLQDVPYGTAIKMTEHLSSYQTNPAQVPEHLKGYDPNWNCE